MVSDVEFLARCKMHEFDIDFETTKEWVEDDLNEFDMLSKMTSKEKHEYLKRGMLLPKRKFGSPRCASNMK